MTNPWTIRFWCLAELVLTCQHSPLSMMETRGPHKWSRVLWLWLEMQWTISTQSFKHFLEGLTYTLEVKILEGICTMRRSRGFTSYYWLLLNSSLNKNIITGTMPRHITIYTSRPTTHDHQHHVPHSGAHCEPHPSVWKPQVDSQKGGGWYLKLIIDKGN